MVAGSHREIRSPGRARQWLALLAFLLLAALLVSLVPSSATSADEETIRDAGFAQAGKSLILQIRTAREVNLGKLDRLPDFQGVDARYLCAELNRLGRPGTTRICVGGKKKTYRAVGVSRTGPAGRVGSARLLRAEVKKVDGLRLVVTLDLQRAGLPSGMYRWRIADRSGKCRQGGERVDERAEDCLSHYPAKRYARYFLRPIRMVGCTGGNGEVVRRGPARGKMVALTFDDGPSDYTPEVLRILGRTHARATFFMLGQQVARYPAYARRVLAEGHEIANHSYDHPLLPGGSNIRRATRTIEGVTGFRPCLFRPPYGALNGSVRGAVATDHMKSVLWDVDTSDWKLPGAGSIKSTILRASRPGSIVLMHDGGGPRGGTVDALEGAIRGLRRRGYKLVTVTELLGNRFLFRPKPRR